MENRSDVEKFVADKGCRFLDNEGNVETLNLLGCRDAPVIIIVNGIPFFGGRLKIIRNEIEKSMEFIDDRL